MSRKGQTLRELLEPLREKYFISGEINTKVGDMDAGAGEDRRRWRRATPTARPTRSTASRSEYPGLALQRARLEHRADARLNLEATTQEMMEEKRDEVLAFIRG